MWIVSFRCSKWGYYSGFLCSPLNGTTNELKAWFATRKTRFHLLRTTWRWTRQQGSLFTLTVKTRFQQIFQRVNWNQRIDIARWTTVKRCTWVFWVSRLFPALKDLMPHTFWVFISGPADGDDVAAARWSLLCMGVDRGTVSSKNSWRCKERCLHGYSGFPHQSTHTHQIFWLSRCASWRSPSSDDIVVWFQFAR